MLDNGAMVYPEGDEEPFNFGDGKRFEFTFITRKKNTEENKETKKDEDNTAKESDGK